MPLWRIKIAYCPPSAAASDATSSTPAEAPAKTLSVNVPPDWIKGPVATLTRHLVSAYNADAAAAGASPINETQVTLRIAPGGDAAPSLDPTKPVKTSLKNGAELVATIAHTAAADDQGADSAAAAADTSASESADVTVVRGLDGAMVAKVFLRREHINPETLAQIEYMAKHPAVRSPRVMPDCHKGNGCCVGFTSKLQPVITPQLIGGDIGCGVTAHPFPAAFLAKRNGPEKVHRAMKDAVPMGNGAANVHQDAASAVPLEAYEPFLAEASATLQSFCAAYQAAFAVDLMKEFSAGDTAAAFQFTVAWLRQRVVELGLDEGYFLRAMGTLGGGNHFIEVDTLQGPSKDDTADDEGDTRAVGTATLPEALLVVHSGSRCIGQAIYRHWTTIAAKRREVALEDVAAAPAAPSEPASDAAALPADDDESIRFDAKLLLSEPADVAGYYRDMVLAQALATMNRRAMLAAVLGRLGLPFEPSTVVESTHNYIDFNDLVVRKGAIRAAAGAKCLIALNMREGVWLCEGAGNPDWNGSAAHGCGRIASRAAAKAKQGSTSTKSGRQALLRQFDAELGDVVSDRSLDLYDERPSAYRASSVVREALLPRAARLLGHYATVVNAKGA